MSNSGVAPPSGGASFNPGILIAPTGTISETMSRDTVIAGGGSFTPPSGTLALAAIGLATATKISNISFTATGASSANTPGNWWFGLYDNNFHQLAVTANQLTAAWAASATKTLAIANIASGAATSFTTTYSGVYYIGFLMTAVTVVQLFVTGNQQALTSLPPIMGGSSDTTQTTPPAFPHTATTPGGTYKPYGYVS